MKNGNIEMNLYFFYLTFIICTAISLATFANSKSNSLIILNEEKHDVSLPLRYLTSTSNTIRMNALLNKLSFANTTIVPLHGFQGIGVGLGDYKDQFAAPDTSGAVGMMHYVQLVNHDFAVFDKATGRLAPGFPKPINTVWAGFGTLCEFRSSGQPFVRYDQLAHRWVLTQLAYEETEFFYQCIAVSTTEDPTGSYYRYAFQVGSLNDYPVLAVWPNAYFMTFNMLGPNAFGPRVCAFDRAKMLDGKRATAQCHQLSFDESGPLLPADLDGQTLPPDGAPGYFLSVQKPTEFLFYRFQVDFDNPYNSIFKPRIFIPVKRFELACPERAGNACAIQPDTDNKLDTLSYRLMPRLVYRQFADHASLLALHTIQGSAPKFSPALRWYELRFTSPHSFPVIYQQGTYEPDSKNRFMGSIAMDRLGDIAIGYTVSSRLVHPSPELSWREASDELNKLTHLQSLVTGHGSQINDVHQWGHASSLTIDPVDDCTFWYTSEYLKETGSFNWSTFILNFRLGHCRSLT